MLADFLRQETSGGRLLLLATAVALLWANVAGDLYGDVWGADAGFGPAFLHLDGLTLADWAADGLLAVFFFVAGMEVKRELVTGELAGRRAAALPVLAALGGMVVPALVAIAASGGDAASDGVWAIPVATDIAFALGVLALFGSSLPLGARVLLLSMAVVDDLAAIALIAVLFTDGIAIGWVAVAAVACAAFGVLIRRPGAPAAALWAIAVVAWVAVHATGVHATVTGIALGLLVPVRPPRGGGPSVAERLEHRLHPVSAGFVVPVFALAVAGISLEAVADVPGDAVATGIVAGLVIGKPLGIVGGAWLAVRARLGELPAELRLADVLPLAVLGGIGYTVSLLVARLSLDDAAAAERAAAGVLVASTIASVAGAALLRRRYR